MRESDKTFNESFCNVDCKPIFERYRIKGNKIRYVSVGSDTLPTVLFIHGAPASMSFWKPFFKDSSLLSMARVAAVDRPGYGYSSFGNLYLSYYAQAALLEPVIRKFGSKNKLILVGSSYGGPLCALLAALYPDLVDGLLMISTSIAPGEEATWDIVKVINSPIGEFFPQVLQVATAEKLNHKKMLEEISNEWEKVICPTIILHGSADELIYPTNASFVFNKFIKAPKSISILGGLKHNIVLTKPAIVVNKIMELLYKPTMACK